ncbi:MAG: sulfite exporter TauE/SafE family protein [Spirulina sp. SIO3F2]|nr:sulfite exporter TauE/SafE family protein [Spirulina sp. SIO3F2]
MDAIGILILGGLGAGLLSGLLGIGGGTVMVPLLVAVGYSYNQSVATSSLAIVITALSGTLQNWRMGFLRPRAVLMLALPAIATAQIGAYLVGQLPDFVKEAGFGLLLVVTIFLVRLKQQLVQLEKPAVSIDQSTIPPAPLSKEGNSLPPTSLPCGKPQNRLGKGGERPAQLGTGAMAGLLAGLFGVGGGVIMVPLQMLLLQEPIKTAIRTSLGVIVLTSISACIGHAQQGNVVAIAGLILGSGGLVGAQVSTRFLPKLPDRLVSLCFRLLLIVLAVYFFWRAVQSYPQG